MFFFPNGGGPMSSSIWEALIVSFSNNRLATWKQKQQLNILFFHSFYRYRYSWYCDGYRNIKVILKVTLWFIITMWTVNCPTDRRYLFVQFKIWI
jgi:hypothetical protein